MKYIATIITPITQSCRQYRFVLLAALLGLANTHALAQVCNPVTVTAASPYTEGFEGLPNNTTYPNCTLGTTGVLPFLAPVPTLDVPRNGNGFLQYKVPSNSFGLDLLWVTEDINMVAGHVYNFTYWYKTNGTGWTMRARVDELLQTPIPNYPVNFEDLTLPAEDSVTNELNPTYALATGSFYCTTSGTQRLGIEAYGNMTTKDLLIDDVTIAPAKASVGKPSLNIQGPSTICNAPINSPALWFNLYDSTNLFTYGITYQWQSSPAGANTYINVPGGTSNAVNATIRVATDYRLIATDTLTHLSDTSVIHTVAITPSYLCVCQPATDYELGGGGSTSLIDSVTVVNTTLHNQTYAPLPNAYKLFAPGLNTTTTLYRNSTYTINALMNTLGSSCEVWLDADGDGLFGGTRDVNTVMASSFLSYISTGTITIPRTGTYSGPAILRIRSASDGNGDQECDSLSMGETEDYVVNIAPEQLNDMSAQAIIQPSLGSNVCANSTFAVSVQIFNAGSLPQSNFPVGATFPGNPNPIFAIYTGTIMPNATATFTVGTLSIPAGGTYSIKAYTGLANDQNHSNDTTFTSVVVNPLPADPIVHSDTVCNGDNDTLRIDGVAGNVYNWYNGPSGGSVLFTGTEMDLLGITNNTTYYVSSSTPGMNGVQNGGPSDSAGCSGGIMFNITPSTNLTIDNFVLYFNHTGLQPVSIYYKVGTYVGFQNTPGAWYLLGSTAVNVTNTSSPYPVTVNAPLNITNGNSYALYLSYDGQNTPVEGTADPIAPWPINSTFSGPDLTISIDGPIAQVGHTMAGSELCGFFNNVIVDKQFNFFGSINYHIGGSDCESNRVPVTAAVGPNPVVNLGPDDTVCYSPTLYLDAGNPGATYLWNTGDTTQRINVYKSGTFTYTVTVDKYCQAITASKTVDVLPLPSVLGINYVEQNNTFTFSASGVQNVTGYEWDFGDGMGGSNLASPTYTYATATSHTVRLIVSNNQCGVDTVYWYVPTTGVTNVNSTRGDINLYPNPAYTSVTVSALDNLELQQIIIVNAIGQEVYNAAISNKKAESIDISKLPPGNYIMRANTSSGAINKLFEVMHQ